MKQKFLSLRSLIPGVPYLWLLLFFALPFVIVLKISLAEFDEAIPPYTPLFSWVEQSLRVLINFGNYLFLFEDPIYLQAYLGSLKIAAVSTALCLLLGYPMAYAMAQAPRRWQSSLLLLVLLPSWTSFLIRIYAWMGILNNGGLLNSLLLWCGLIDQPLTLLHTDTAVYIGVVYAYLPFMVLPLYANLVRLDQSLLEASADLGARPWRTWWSVTLPLSRSGMIAGSLLVFVPVVGEYVIPELLGGSGTLMIGKLLWQEFFNNRDWPVAAALAIVMLLVLCVPIALFHRHQARQLGSDA